MKRLAETVCKHVYTTDAGRRMIEICGDKANITVAFCTPDELCELAMACRAAAEELRSTAEVEGRTTIHAAADTAVVARS